MNDLSKLLKSNNKYFNATKIAGQYNKLVAGYLRNDYTKEYINAVSKKYNIKYSELVKIQQGGGNEQGTWLHNMLIIDFARWCSPEFGADLDAKIYKKYNKVE